MKTSVVIAIGALTSISMFACTVPEGSTSTQTVTQEPVKTETPVTAEDLRASVDVPRTMEGEEQMIGLEAKSSDGQRFTMAITFGFTIKAHPTPATYKRSVLDPAVARGCMETVQKHTKEELTEDNFRSLREEMFIAVNERIDPLVCEVDLVILDALRPIN